MPGTLPFRLWLSKELEVVYTCLFIWPFYLLLSTPNVLGRHPPVPLGQTMGFADGKPWLEFHWGHLLPG